VTTSAVIQRYTYDSASVFSIAAVAAAVNDYGGGGHGVHLSRLAGHVRRSCDSAVHLVTMSSSADKTTVDASRLYGASSHDSVDSQFTEPDDDEVDEELRFFEACVECDDDALYDVIHDGVTWDEVNKCDKSGRVSSPSVFS